MNYIYTSTIISEDTGDTVAQISSFSQEGLEEESGKSKWTKAVQQYEERLVAEKEHAEE